MRPWRGLGRLCLPVALSACVPGLLPPPEAPPQLGVTPGERLLRLNIPQLQAQAPMKQIGDAGGVVTWMSADAYTLSLDRGILVGSRGFGYDLMGASAEASLAAFAQEDEGALYRRQWRYLSSDNHSLWLQAGCAMTRHPPSEGLRHLTETCQTATTQFTNHYWLSEQDEILRSKQWLSPEIGLVEIHYSKGPP